MNDELRMSDDELRQATARALAAEGQMDGEMAALREGFLALGKGLDAETSRGDEATLVAQLQRWSRSAETGAAPVIAPARRTELKWPVLLGGALALSALIVAVQVVRQWPGEIAVVTPVAVEIAKDVPQAENEGHRATDEVSPNAVYSTVAWQDALDYEIASAEAGMRRLASREQGLDGSLSDMNTRLQALSQELWGGQL